LLGRYWDPSCACSCQRRQAQMRRSRSRFRIPPHPTAQLSNFWHPAKRLVENILIFSRRCATLPTIPPAVLYFICHTQVFNIKKHTILNITCCVPSYAPCLIHGVFIIRVYVANSHVFPSVNGVFAPTSVVPQHNGLCIQRFRLAGRLVGVAVHEARHVINSSPLPQP
jgi:hypothetical protein